MENPHLDPDKKVEHILRKAKSKHRYEFVTWPKDDWFIFVNQIENKTDKLVHSSLIIRKDKEVWLRYMTGTRMGWTEAK